MRILCYLIFLAFFVNKSNGQSYLDLLEFDSEVEKKTYSKVFLDSSFNNIDLDVYFNLFLLTNSSDTIYSTIFKKEIDYWEKELLTNRKFSKDSKKAELIHKKLHEDVLDKYVSNATPEMIFNNGDYNCVTATGVAYYLAKKLGLNVDIQEEPNHVYPKLIINDSDYKIETTSVTFQSHKKDEAAKIETIEQLASHKLIDINEYPGKTSLEIFSIIYEKNRTVTFKELIGIQYNNQSIFAINENKNDLSKAVKNSAKAYGLLKNDLHHLILFSSLYDYLVKCDFNTPQDFKNLMLIAHLNIDKYQQKLINNIFYNFSNKTIVEKSNLNSYNKVTTYLLKNLRDSAIISDIEYTYNLFMADETNRKGNFIQSAEHIEKSLRIKPSQKEILDQYVQVLNSILNKNLNDSITNSIVNKHQDFPDLINLYNYKLLVTRLAFKDVYDALQKRRITLLKSSIEHLESTFQQFGNDILPEYEIANLYNAISVVYFENNYTSVAKKYIKKAIQLDPDNLNHTDLLKVYTY